jgi:hypothetical protein
MRFASRRASSDSLPSTTAAAAAAPRPRRPPAAPPRARLPPRAAPPLGFLAAEAEAALLRPRPRPPLPLALPLPRRPPASPSLSRSKSPGASSSSSARGNSGACDVMPTRVRLLAPLASGEVRSTRQRARAYRNPSPLRRPAPPAWPASARRLQGAGPNAAQSPPVSNSIPASCPGRHAQSTLRCASSRIVSLRASITGPASCSYRLPWLACWPRPRPRQQAPPPLP